MNSNTGKTGDHNQHKNRFEFRVISGGRGLSSLSPIESEKNPSANVIPFPTGKRHSGITKSWRETCLMLSLLDAGDPEIE